MRNIPFLLWVLLLVDGVSNEENVSRKEGESVTLPLEPGEINEDDLIQWWFDGQMIANMIKEDKITNTFPGPGDIFKERLKLDDQTGSLTIRNIVAKHAGDYELKIHGKTETSKIFRVTVSVSDKKTLDQKTPDEQTPDPGLSPGAVAGIVVVVLLSVFAAAAGVIFYRKKISELRSSNDVVKESQESNNPLNSGSANGEGL